MSEILSSTPLHNAVKEQNVEAVSLLISQGAVDVNAKNSDGSTALHMAAEAVQHTEIFELLLQANDVNINLKNKKGRTALEQFLDSEFSRSSKCSDNLYVIFKLFVDLKADIFSKDNFNNTLLHLAVRENNFSMVEYLLDQGLDVNCKNKFGITPLSYVNYREDKFYGSVMELLLERNADPNKKDIFGKTPFHSLLERFPEVVQVKTFIKYGADVFAICKEGRSALHFAVTEHAYTLTLKELLEKGLDVNCTDSNFRTPFFEAAFRANVTVLKFLIKNGAKVNEVDHYGNTALMDLIEFISQDDYLTDEDAYYSEWVPKNKEALTLLIRHVDVNIMNFRGENILSDTTLPDWCDKIIIEKLVILTVLGTPVRSEIMDAISCDEFRQNYYLECENELLRAKDTFFYGKVSYFDLLVCYKSNDKVNYKNCSDLIDSFLNCDPLVFQKNFPIYGYAITVILEEATDYRPSAIDSKKQLDHYIRMMYHKL